MNCSSVGEGGSIHQKNKTKLTFLYIQSSDSISSESGVRASLKRRKGKSAEPGEGRQIRGRNLEWVSGPYQLLTRIPPKRKGKGGILGCYLPIFPKVQDKEMKQEQRVKQNN
ncbi:unnamed protein product [Rangifer tarandus platyrhynchus]|uniref:Uncharacterized protein n=2 Tax=Rangifer tarandus platyrhynchus TaxID=3082113 RepID=A0AC59Y463_RANTA|nr:unnamed protein product [Rangifer tarandus platyrhynchus]